MLSKRKVILAGVETTYGQDPGLTAAANAIMVESVSLAYEGANMVARPVVKASLGQKQQIHAGALLKASISVEVKGSGAAGTAPEIAPLLRACALGETVSAGVSVTYAPASSSLASVTLYLYLDGMRWKIHGAVGTCTLRMEAGQKIMADFELTGHGMCTGTAQSATATTLVIASTSSSTDDVYNTQTINIVSGTGAGQSRTISDYTGSTKTCTVTAWSPTPDNTSVYEIVGGPTDTAMVSPTYDSTAPVALKGVPLTVGSYAGVITSLELSMGNQIATPGSLRSPNGYAQVLVVGREPSGSFNPEATLVATKDWENEWFSGQQQAIDTGLIGSTAGNRVRLQVPYAYYREISQSDRDGVFTYDVGFAAAESSGDDEISLAFT